MTTTITDDKLKTRVEQALQNLTDLPVPVRRWDVKVGDDIAGEQAVWVWAILDDVDVTSDNCYDIRNSVREAVDQAMGDQPPWVYIRFRGTSEV